MMDSWANDFVKGEEELDYEEDIEYEENQDSSLTTAGQFHKTQMNPQPRH